MNPEGTTSGADPESIDDAYRKARKMVGTFDTLVSTRDYESYIYNMAGAVNSRRVSNVVVNDRTDDLSYSTKVITKMDGDRSVGVLHVDK